MQEITAISFSTQLAVDSSMLDPGINTECTDCGIS